MRINRFVLTAIFLPLAATSHANSFFDDFEDGMLDDGMPVSWIAREGTMQAVAGSMELTPAPSGGASAYVEDFDHENILIEMTFEYTLPASQFVTPLFRERLFNGLADYYYAGVFPDGELVIGYFEGPPVIGARNIFLPTGPIDAGDDVTLLVKMLEGAITLEAWETAAGRAQSATLSWTDALNRFPTGTDIGVGFSANGNPAPVLIHEFGVTLIPDCDFGMDGSCDIDDIDALVMEIVAETHDPIFDLNGDSFVDLADRDEWLAAAGAENLPSGNPYLVADFNLDGFVDGTDFIRWNANKFSNAGKWSLADANADGVTDGQDFIEWNSNKFMSSDGVTAVPEPAMGALWIIAMIVMAITRWH